MFLTSPGFRPAPGYYGPLNPRCFFFQRQRFPNWAFVLVARGPDYERHTKPHNCSKDSSLDDTCPYSYAKTTWRTTPEKECLGESKRDKMPSSPSKKLDTFENPQPGRNYEIRFDCPEFTCLCPVTGQPDFATIKIHYVPDATCVELKSLKLYLWSFRDEGQFHEAVTNRILDDLVAAISPRQMTVRGDFWVRGGITTVVEAKHPNPEL